MQIEKKELWNHQSKKKDYHADIFLIENEIILLEEHGILHKEDVEATYAFFMAYSNKIKA